MFAFYFLPAAFKCLLSSNSFSILMIKCSKPVTNSTQEIIHFLWDKVFPMRLIRETKLSQWLSLIYLVSFCTLFFLWLDFKIKLKLESNLFLLQCVRYVLQDMALSCQRRLFSLPLASEGIQALQRIRRRQGSYAEQLLSLQRHKLLSALNT